jgi:protein-tyrosine kinase
MSRIEEALRRARAAGSPPGSRPTDPAGGPGHDPNESGETSEISDSPWDFGAGHDATNGPVPGGEALFGPSARRGAPTLPDVRQRALHSALQEAEPSNASPVFGGFDPTVEERTVISPSIPAVSVEQYRRLAATLHHMQEDRGTRRVMLSSAVTGEGKSLTATNLALTLAQSYRRKVLLIDADLRRPTLHRIFQVQNVNGLGEALKSPEDRRLSIVEISDRLSLLPAGRPNPDPMSALTSERMRRILHEASQRFDWVIIDTPPVALLTDANLLAAMVDAALVVVHATRTPHDMIQRAIEAIGRDKIIGVILNQVEKPSFSGDAHAYYDAYR